METKICKNCGLEKNIDEFYFRKDTQKHRNKCKQCCINNRREYYQENRIKLCNQKKEYTKKNKEIIKAKQKEKYYKNREKILEEKKNYYQKNREAIKEKTKKYRMDNKDKIQKAGLKYRMEHREELSKRSVEYELIRKKTDNIYYFKKRIRQSIRTSFNKKGLLKPQKTEDILGCSINFFINWLIKSYEDNYNEKWNWNYLKSVHIDHKKPLKEAKTEKEIIELCHYTNLQLLKAEDNLAKGSKY